MSSEIENLLRQMPLRKPSADLEARVADAFAAGAASTETRRANTQSNQGAPRVDPRPHCPKRQTIRQGNP